MASEVADTEAARELLARWTGREIEFVVPSHWPLEVLNGIRSRIVKKLIDPARAHDLAKDFVAMNVVPTDITVHAAQIYETAIAFDRTTYDKRFYNAVASKKPFVRYVGNVVPPKRTA